MAATFLNNQFLIAMPGMDDPNFAQTVTLVCEHSPRGALGIIINRPLTMDLGEVFEQLGLDASLSQVSRQSVLLGGPVQTDRGFVLHRPAGDWQSSLAVNSEIALTSSRDILQAMGSAGSPSEVLVSLGYAGWTAGQLEWELAQNAWLTVEADPAIIFAQPTEERLAAAMQLLGVDFANLSDVAGHA